MSIPKASGRGCAQEYGIRIRFAGSTSKGLVRENNEDNFLLANLTNGIQYPRNSTCIDFVYENGSLFAVCDGMGGAAAGEVASEVALDSLFNTMREHRPPESHGKLANRLVKSVEQASHRVYQIAQEDSTKRGMGTTLTAAVLFDRVLFLAQIGDSRAYLLRKGKLKQLTKDQTLTNQLIELGVLDKEDSMNHQASNLILQAIGARSDISVDISFVKLCKDDRLMICSDGLSGMVCEDEIQRILVDNQNPFDCCMRLIAAANINGGNDNITTIIADFDGTDLLEPDTDDTFGYQQYLLSGETSDQGIAAATTARPPGKRKRVVESHGNKPPASDCSTTEPID